MATLSQTSPQTNAESAAPEVLPVMLALAADHQGKAARDASDREKWIRYSAFKRDMHRTYPDLGWQLRDHAVEIFTKAAGL